MTKVTIDRKDLLDFLSSFGKGVTDVRMSCAGNRLTVEVGFSTYYLRKQLVGASVEEEGFIHIALLEKATAFLKASKQTSVTLRQSSETKPLHMEAGGNKLQLPSTDDITSAAKTVAVRALRRFTTYRGATFAGVVTNTMFGFVYAGVFAAVHEVTGTIDGFTTA